MTFNPGSRVRSKTDGEVGTVVEVPPSMFPDLFGPQWARVQWDCDDGAVNAADLDTLEALPADSKREGE